MAIEVPESKSTVTVKIVDTGCRVHLPPSRFVTPSIAGHDDLACPAYSFFIENESLGRKIIFDLGVKKDWEELPGPLLDNMKGAGLQIDRGRDVYEVLEESNIDLRSIEALIWSHHHFDHTGTPSHFPSTSVLVVGQGFKKEYIPGFPTNEKSSLLEKEYIGRDMREVNFDTESNGLEIGGMQAVDYFGDGSFYLLDSPGHAVGHMCGLARTTASPQSFIMMGADTAHHGGEYRPSSDMPLPDVLDPSPFGLDSPLNSKPGVCPGSLFVNQVHPHHSPTRPFYSLAPKGPSHDLVEAEASIEKMQRFDADDRVFVVIAHDTTLLDVLGFWPSLANEWQAKGWKEKGRWKFLEDFREAFKTT
ncbi:MAG: hypothetical protein M1820_001105 [Bogoriella megaspora]|nr:MAG: hypothetical protein M1820_001105 [Bogoriella megaspora]